MPLQTAFIGSLQTALSEATEREIKIYSISAVGGGSINLAYCVSTNYDKFMLKVNSLTSFPNMFAVEAQGLKTIGHTKTISVPEVVLQGDFEDQSFLVMKWIEKGTTSVKASETLGRQLSKMHRCRSAYFGLDYDNYMGSLPQSNSKHNSWSDFYIKERLQPMVKLALGKGFLQNNDAKNFDNLYLNVEQLFNEEAPSLIHGDLWGGNYMINLNEQPYLIDPAITYGNREFDIAMTTLFGGFSVEFYDAYNESFPLQKGWQQRLTLWNLYPLLIHLNLFGTGYLGQVRDALNLFI